MALLNPTFIFGIIVLAYLSTFVCFAILRILTGISIQRIGYFSLRRLAYTPRDGIKVEIRGLGLNLHRPTFAQPTWMSVVLTELAVTVDLNAADRDKQRHDESTNEDDEGEEDEEEQTSQDAATEGPELKKKLSRAATFAEQNRSRSWQKLMSIKDRIKRLHRKINWIRMVDVVATNSTITITDVGHVQVGHFTAAVDTRRKMVDRGRMFSHVKTAKKNQRPAEWIFTVRSVLFTADGRDSLEVLDHATLNVHGLLYEELDGLRDAAIGLKLGRVHIPYDDIEVCFGRFKAAQKLSTHQYSKPLNISVTDLIEEIDHPGSQEETLVQTVSDSKEFASSILRGIKEVQFAVSYVGFTKKVDSIRPQGSPLYLNASMKEVGVDLHRLDQKSPAHRMYFSSKDVAHQALVAALSIAVGVDDGHGQSAFDRLVYIPMATTTVRTTLPAKTVELSQDNSADERNANILFANVVVTSPSIDLDPKHLPLVLALLQPKSKPRNTSTPSRHIIISRLLPKANVKFSMHEPVIRIALPPVENSAEEDDFDLIISSISSVSLDIESSHSATGNLHYGVASTFRVLTHDLYYQTSSGAHFQLLQTESLELKVQVSANPEVNVAVVGNLQTFSIHMIRPEISDGVRQIVRQLRLNVEPDKRVKQRTSRDPNFIRALPAWLQHFQLQASNFSAEVAGVDEEISEDTRGLAINLESWTAEYRAQKGDALEKRSTRRRTTSRSVTPDAEMLLKMPSSPRKRNQQHPTDGRRFAVHTRGLDFFVVESADKWETEPFISIPRSEVALSTSSDNQGPIFHVNSHVKTLVLRYSLYRHYACGIATSVLRKAFVRTKADVDEARRARENAHAYSDSAFLSPVKSPEDFYTRDAPEYPFTTRELVTVDFKSALVQIKLNMPAEPHVLIQIYGVELGRHRWSPPFLHAKLCRLYADAPRLKNVWARILSIKALRVDLREHRRKRLTGETVDEKMIDVNAEAIRFAVPHQLVMHKVFDNFVNASKAVQQLHHRFATGTNEYILDKKPEGPKNVPKISVRTKAFLFEIEDGAFEWKLGSIYRAGLVEQAQHIAREAAFNVKAKKMEEEEMRRESTKFRNRSAHPRGRPKNADAVPARSKSVDVNGGDGIHSRAHRGRKLRYDPEGIPGMSGSAKISIAEAHEQLKRHNAQSWKRRIDRVFKSSKDYMKEMRSALWAVDQPPDDAEEIENVLEIPLRPGLMATLIHDLHITIDKPSFPVAELPNFMHRVGKGIPIDTKYSLLIPMHVQINMGEARVGLRDYPLPLIHVPSLKPGQSPRLSAWALHSDFVIAEEYRNSESTRHVKVDIVPAGKVKTGDTSKKGSFAIDVRRTVSPVKSYSDIKVDINTGYPTRITWGASYQPAIQDMMMVIETFTKPQIDPSDRVGFWDKIRLTFHSRVSVAWKGDGDVHLMLKGTRDPYVVTGHGAGFLMCWRNDVRWNIYREEDPRKFMTVDSGEYILAIPDYSHQARNNEKHDRGDDESMVSFDNFERGASFKKVVMKLAGNVQWMVGLMFERSLGGRSRTFEFEPHYEVILKEPQYARAPPDQVYDAFKGIRSHHIHMSIAVRAPVDRDWTSPSATPSKSYNAVHLTPRFFTHFFAWWAMFNGTMSLPIRQGKLWPGIEKSSKKFGRHLATVKYNLLLAPLFLSHIYKHKDAEDYSEDVVSATGLKIRLDSFMLDIHQRREEFNTQARGRKTQVKTSGMKMNQAQLDLVSADIRAISANIAGTTCDDLQRASTPDIRGQQDRGVTDLSRFEIPDNDFSWIDMDDFVELDWILPSQANPETKILPLAYAPRFTYFRQTDRGDTIAGDPDRTSPWGKEPTHFCIMSKDDDPRRVQCQIIQSRLDQLKQQIANHNRNLGDAELKCIREENNEQYQKELDQLNRHSNVLQDKKKFLESMLKTMSTRITEDIKSAVPDGDVAGDSDGETPMPKEQDPVTAGMDTNPTGDFISDFSNRFVIHNMQLKWNNLLRNIILRYIHQVSQRRGFIYYLSRRAVTFILDIVAEQNRAKAEKTRKKSSDHNTRNTTPSPSAPFPDDQVQEELQSRINDLLADGKKFVNADDPQASESTTGSPSDNFELNANREFAPQNTYHLRLIAPQIQLQSFQNPKAVVLVTAKGMELKVIEVMDKDRLFDDISGLVQRRFSVAMDSTQFFVTHQKWFSSQLLSMYSGSRFGTPAGSAWPPWVPMEVMFDFHTDPFGFKRIVQKTSASLRYNKYNALRLKYNDQISGEGNAANQNNATESRMDHFLVQFPQIRAICNSSQYYAIYIIVMDLLMYSEPMEKTRTERLEKIMLASDFSDLRGAPEMVIRLQERIRQLEEIKTQFQINSQYLDKQGWEDRVLLDKDLTSCEDELFFMMKAITTSQRKYDGSQSSGLLQWNISANEIVWHLMQDNNEPLIEVQLQKADYNRTDNTDGSHINLVQIGKIMGLNLLPHAIYPVMLAPHLTSGHGNFDEGSNQKMLRVYWYMLEAIAGISVVDHFEVNLFPMKIQMEHEVSKRLFEYVFPGSNEKSLNISPYVVKNMQFADSNHEEGMEPVDINELLAAEDESMASNTRAGSLELRLKPTMTSEPPSHLPKPNRGKGASLHSSKGSGDSHHFRLFQPTSKPSSTARLSAGKTLSKKSSIESLQASIMARQGISRTPTGQSISETINGDSKSKKFQLPRNSTKSKKEKPSDDLTKMIARASEYKTMAYIKMPGVQLCLSYKGKGNRNIEDVHEFDFNVPEIEFRNKTWSYLDLILAFKKEIVRALISHSGALLGNKLSRHRPSTAQQNRLRELATSSMLLAPPSNDTSYDNSDASSTFASSPTDTKYSDRSKSPRRSFASSHRSSTLARTPSASSSAVSIPPADQRVPSFPTTMSMTPVQTGLRSSSSESQTTNEEGSHQGKEGFMAHTLQKLKQRRDRSENNAAGTSTSTDTGEDGVKKAKSILGKKILNTLT